MFLLVIKYYCFKFLDVINGKFFIFLVFFMEVIFVFIDVEINYVWWLFFLDFLDLL